EFKFGHEVRNIMCDGEVITGANVNGGTIRADYYVAALPIDVMGPLVTDAMIAIDRGLGGLRALKGDTEWMTGVQFYLKDDVSLGQGHQMHLDSPWALTSLSQAQFWKPDIDLGRDYGDGTVKGIISVDISDWSRRGLNGKPARHCSRDEIIE